MSNVDIRVYCDMIKGKADMAAAVVVKQALGAPMIFFYGQLFHTPEVQALKNSSAGKGSYDLIQLFTYGTVKDVEKMAEDSKKLVTTNLMTKLKQLTIVTLAASNRRLSYNALMNDLGIKDVRELEDLVIDSITDGLIGARLDQQGSVVEVHEVAARDVRLDDLDRLLEALDGWYTRCDQTAKQLGAAIKKTNDEQSFYVMRSKQMALDEESMLEICKGQLIEMSEELEMAAARGAGRMPTRPGARPGSGRATGGY